VTFKLFAELIATHLNAFDRLEASEARLLSEQQASELREQFIAVLGHDLRNPLASIAAGARMMTKVKSEKETFDILGLMHSSIARMSQLIDNVLDFARERLGGGLTLDRTTTEPIDKILEQVIAETRSSHPDATIETQLNVTEPVKYDPQRMSQMFSNLLGNAVAHGSTERPIKVHATTQNHEFELSVVNAGEPIPDAALKQLFQPFYRGAVRPSQQGLGLGLFIASEIARAHGTKWWELRTAVTLARLLRDRDRAAEARELLRSAYDGFNEGLDLPDLRAAQELLKSLQSAPHARTC